MTESILLAAVFLQILPASTCCCCCCSSATANRATRQDGLHVYFGFLAERLLQRTTIIYQHGVARISYRATNDSAKMRSTTSQSLCEPLDSDSCGGDGEPPPITSRFSVQKTGNSSRMITDSRPTAARYRNSASYRSSRITSYAIAKISTLDASFMSRSICFRVVLGSASRYLPPSRMNVSKIDWIFVAIALLSVIECTAINNGRRVF